jgi:hypothetical protein
VHAVQDLSARRSGGSVRLSWRDAGPGVRYRVYLRSPGSGYVFLRTADISTFTLSKLAHGTQYQVMIIPENIDDREGPEARIAITGP